MSTTYLDIFIEITLIRNILELTGRDKYKDNIVLELHFEKLTILNQLLKQLNSSHINLFTKIINKLEFKDSIFRVF